jgi:thioredoxin 1
MNRRHFGSYARVLFCACILFAAGCTRGTSEGTPGEATKAASTGVRAGTKVTFIELGSVKCIPCVKMQEVMRDIEREYGDQVEVVFHDVWTDAGKPFAEKFHIRVIPTQVFLDSEGKEYFRHEGYFPKEGLVEVLRQKGVK